MKQKEYESIVNQCIERFGRKKTLVLIGRAVKENTKESSLDPLTDEEANEKVNEIIGNYLKAKLEE